MNDEILVQDLLIPLWDGVSTDYKRQYSYSVWNQFEDNLRSAAYTAQLSKFLEKITQRLNITLRTEYVARVAAVINCGEDKTLLKSLREETALLVLLVRVANEERHDRYEAQQQKGKKGKADADVLARGPGDEPELDLA
jgi:hypothetical protein